MLFQFGPDPFFCQRAHLHDEVDPIAIILIFQGNHPGIQDLREGQRGCSLALGLEVDAVARQKALHASGDLRYLYASGHPRSPGLYRASFGRLTSISPVSPGLHGRDLL